MLKNSINGTKYLKRIFKTKTNFNNYIKFSSEKKYQTVQDLKNQRFQLLGIDYGYKPNPPDRSHLLQYTPKYEDLPPRNIKDSYLEARIPLSTDIILQEKYVTFLGRLRIGRLFEDMDLFAVHIGYQHIFAPTVPPDIPSPFTLVTALCDEIGYTTFERKNNEDVKLSGFTSWVGRSSMEVVVWLEQHYKGEWHRITRAFFILVAKDATGTKTVPVNPLKPLNDYEKTIIQSGETRKLKRLQDSKTHISQALPSQSEQELIHELYKKTRKTKYEELFADLPYEDYIPMEKCRITNYVFCQPEDRNFYNTIFGGFIMREATEFAWVLGYQFFRQRPSIYHISNIKFLDRIAVNAVLNMKAQIVYTHECYAQVIVNVFAIYPVEGSFKETNTFNFTMKSKDIIKKVYPKTYHEAMLYIDGKRQLDLILDKCTIKATDTMDEYLEKLRKERGALNEFKKKE